MWSIVRWKRLQVSSFPAIFVGAALLLAVSYRLLRGDAFPVHHESTDMRNSCSFFTIWNWNTKKSVGLSRLLASSINDSTPQNVAIVGGGLAGLSATYHLLQKTSNTVSITIFDKAPVGTAGASSVAGGLLHPLSPRGKLVHGGLECLAATNHLIEAAQHYKPDCVVCNQLYRVALSEENVRDLQQTARLYPDFSEWLSRNDIRHITQSPHALGGLRLFNGCKVLYVPSYLEGLWMACCHEHPTASEWSVEPHVVEPTFDWKGRLQDYDAVVLAAGAGLFQNSILSTSLPVDLIRGQSIKMTTAESTLTCKEALLCGKYVSPLPQDDRFLIGATHECKPEPLSEQEVMHDLRQRSFQLAPILWETGNVDKITSGYRVQTRRGKFGRIPIVGKLESDIHPNAWIFTGLSSRGLLHHGLFGEVLVDRMLGNCNDELWKEYNLDWWRH